MDTLAHSEGNPFVPRQHRVKALRRETADTFTIELSSSNGDGEKAFAAGQFNMLYVFGVGEVPISISGDPAKPKTFLHTTRAVGAVTKAMARLTAGDTIGVRGPFGTHWPVVESQGNDVIIIGGGIGLAPLRPAVYQILNQREKYGKVIVLYGTRTPDDILFRREIEQWRARFDLDVHVSVDRAAPSWRGSVGVVTTLIPRASLDPLNTVAMVCGPELMMRFTVFELEKRGISLDRIYISMERNMKCGTGLCGHCQYGPAFVCKDGPVFPYARIKDLFLRREI